MPKADFGLPSNMEDSQVEKKDIKGLSWEIPSKWEVSDGHSMRLASFNVPFSNGIGDLSIVSLSGASGSIAANVNRWRGQLGLPNISEIKILSQAIKKENKLGAFDLFRLTNKEQKDKAILAAVMPMGAETLFIKLAVE